MSFIEYIKEKHTDFKNNQDATTVLLVCRFADEYAKYKSKRMQSALEDIANWNDDLEYEYDDTGVRAKIGLGLIAI